MPFSQSPTTRRLFLASLVLFAFSLVFSVTNVVTVLSAPLRTVSVPTQVGFEGYLVEAGTGNPLTGTHDLTFKLYDGATNGTPLSWTNVLTNVTVTNGLYSVLLNGLPVSTFTGDRWLGVKVDTGTEITPRTRIGSVPFALNAQAAEEVAWSGITGKPSGFADGTDDVGTGVPGSGAAGRVSVWDSTTSVAGATGLALSGNIKIGRAHV